MSLEMSALALEEPRASAGARDVRCRRCHSGGHRGSGIGGPGVPGRQRRRRAAAIGLGRVRVILHAPARSQRVDVRAVHLHERLQQRRVRDVRRVRSRSASLTGASPGGPARSIRIARGCSRAPRRPSSASLRASEPRARARTRRGTSRLHRAARATARGSSTTRATPSPTAMRMKSARRVRTQPRRKTRRYHPVAAAAARARARASSFAFDISASLGCDLELLLCGCQRGRQRPPRARPLAREGRTGRKRRREQEECRKAHTGTGAACDWRLAGRKLAVEAYRIVPMRVSSGGLLTRKKRQNPPMVAYLRRESRRSSKRVRRRIACGRGDGGVETGGALHASLGFIAGGGGGAIWTAPVSWPRVSHAPCHARRRGGSASILRRGCGSR